MTCCSLGEAELNRSSTVIAACTLLIGSLIGAASASIYERRQASRTIELLHAEIALACRTHPEIQAGRHSLCNLIPVSEYMALLAARTGKATIDLSTARQVENAAQEERRWDFRKMLNAELDAFVAECMARTIEQIDKIKNKLTLAEVSFDSKVRIQDENACKREYSMMRQDRQLREKYTSSE